MLKSQKTNKTLILGVLGGGQLAKMLALEAYRLGLNIAIIDNSTDTPAGDMTKLDFTKGWNDKEELDKFIDVSDVVTLENEFINPDILEYIAQKIPVFPTAETMRLVQDKFTQKRVFASHNIDLPHFAAVNSIADMLEFGKQYSYPFLVKTRTLGYDGYGNYTINIPEDCEIAYNKFNTNSNFNSNSNFNISINSGTSFGEARRTLMAESFVDFKSELAVMVARRKSGQLAIYPCVETIQKNHICHKVIAPAQISQELANQAQDLAVASVEAINGVGIFGVELFLTKDDKILVNEIAPRPHNSGHYTIEASATSQYENAIRAVLDLPLGSTEMVVSAACMINLLGERAGSGVPRNIIEVLADGKTSLHIYNKKSSRIGRKMGHLTATGVNIRDVVSAADFAASNFLW